MERILQTVVDGNYPEFYKQIARNGAKTLNDIERQGDEKRRKLSGKYIQILHHNYFLFKLLSPCCRK